MPGCNTAPYKRLQHPLCRQCNYTAHATKPRTGLYSGFSCDCARSTAHDTRPIQQAIALPVPRWRAYQRPDALSLYQIPPPRPDAVQVSTAAYYNNVYKRADHASGGGSASPPAQGQPGKLHSGTGCRGQGGHYSTLHPAGQSSSRGAAGGAEPLAAPAASLFGLSLDS